MPFYSLVIIIINNNRRLVTLAESLVINLLLITIIPHAYTGNSIEQYRALRQ